MSKVPLLECLWNEQQKAGCGSLSPFCSSRTKAEDEIIGFVTEQWTTAVHPSVTAHAALPALTSCSSSSSSKATTAQTAMQTISPPEPLIHPQAASSCQLSVQLQTTQSYRIDALPLSFTCGSHYVHSLHSLAKNTQAGICRDAKMRVLLTYLFLFFTTILLFFSQFPSHTKEWKDGKGQPHFCAAWLPFSECIDTH